MPRKRKTKSSSNGDKMWNSKKKKKGSNGGVDYTLFEELMDPLGEEEESDNGMISMEGTIHSGVGSKSHSCPRWVSQLTLS